MADTIGGQSFIQVLGEGDDPGKILVEISRHGVDGRAFRNIAERAGDVQLKALTDVNNEAAGLALDATYKAMKGAVVSWSKNSKTYTNYLVRDVRITNSMTIVNSVGGVSASGLHLVFSQWLLNKQGPS